MKRFILASASPTRQKFFAKFPYPFEAIASEYEENMTQELSPKELAIVLSAGKARDVASRHKNAVVLGIDTFMVCDGKLLGKPHTKAKAKQMLRMLSGRTHEGISGFTIIDTYDKREYSAVSTARVRFRTLTDNEIDNYVISNEPLDKAGAYASLEMGGMFVDHVEGDFYSLSGVPIAKISQVLADFGINLLQKN